MFLFNGSLSLSLSLHPFIAHNRKCAMQRLWLPQKNSPISCHTLYTYSLSVPSTQFNQWFLHHLSHCSYCLRPYRPLLTILWLHSKLPISLTFSGTFGYALAHCANCLLFPSGVSKHSASQSTQSWLSLDFCPFRHVLCQLFPTPLPCCCSVVVVFHSSLIVGSLCFGRKCPICPYCALGML